MSTEDLIYLREHMPQVFQDLDLPPSWEEDWLFIPIDDPEVDSSSVVGKDSLAPASSIFDFETDDALPARWRVTELPNVGSPFDFPGAPFRRQLDAPMPPPDAFAFYLPFHYYYPTWWGVYIVLEPALELAEYVRSHSSGLLTSAESLAAVKIFLYAHEAFHHIVECLATRLEVTHRQPLYRLGFQQLFDKVAGTDDWTEEMLATAYGWRRVKERFFENNKKKRDAALEALKTYIGQCPPGYRRALEVLTTGPFDNRRGMFAEENQRFSLHELPHLDPSVWSCFPHAFSGIGRVTSRVNYIVPRNSSLALRGSLNLRYLRYRELREKLMMLGGCEPVRQGKGSHEVWRSRDGHSFPVPRHPGDLHRGLLAGIIKQAGIDMPLHEFLAAKA